MEKLMKKKILIISNPGDERAGNYCEGVHKDVENYKKFFTSSLGGNWYYSEIEWMEKPDKATVRRKLADMKKLDFNYNIYWSRLFSA